VDRVVAEVRHQPREQRRIAEQPGGPDGGLDLQPVTVDARGLGGANAAWKPGHEPRDFDPPLGCVCEVPASSTSTTSERSPLAKLPGGRLAHVGLY
jgi:hypothetical protein